MKALRITLTAAALLMLAGANLLAQAPVPPLDSVMTMPPTAKPLPPNIWPGHCEPDCGVGGDCWSPHGCGRGMTVRIPWLLPEFVCGVKSFLCEAGQRVHCFFDCSCCLTCCSRPRGEMIPVGPPWARGIAHGCGGASPFHKGCGGGCKGGCGGGGGGWGWSKLWPSIRFGSSCDVMPHEGEIIYEGGAWTPTPAPPAGAVPDDQNNPFRDDPPSADSLLKTADLKGTFALPSYRHSLPAAKAIERPAQVRTATHDVPIGSGVRAATYEAADVVVPEQESEPLRLKVTAGRREKQEPEPQIRSFFDRAKAQTEYHYRNR